jgi:hypothetical protein
LIVVDDEDVDDDVDEENDDGDADDDDGESFSLFASSSSSCCWSFLASKRSRDLNNCKPSVIKQNEEGVKRSEVIGE